MERSALREARAHEITPRQLSLNIPADTPRYWMSGDPYTTHLMNALSLMFPAGERMFMDTVRHFRDQLRDPRLLSQVRGFLGQEALHGREHKAFNRFLTRFGVPTERIERALEKDVARRRALRTPLEDLAVTCAIEHFTAILAEGWLREAELREMAGEPLRELWTWHAIEELDHKSVAFDVYHEVGGDYRTRVLWMARATVLFLVGASLIHFRFLQADGQLKRPLYLAKRWWRYWGTRGFYSRLVPAYLRYYRRDFHPWQEDHRELIARFEQDLTLQYAAE